MMQAIVLGSLVVAGYVVLTLGPDDSSSPACRAEATTLLDRSLQVERDLSTNREGVPGRARSRTRGEVQLREERYLADLDDFDHRCK